MRPEPQGFEVRRIAWRASDGPVPTVRCGKGRLLERTALQPGVRVGGDDKANTISWQDPAIDLNRVARNQRRQWKLHVRQLYTARCDAVLSAAELPGVPPGRNLYAPTRTVTVNLGVVAGEQRAGAAGGAGCQGEAGADETDRDSPHEPLTPCPHDRFPNPDACADGNDARVGVVSGYRVSR